MRIDQQEPITGGCQCGEVAYQVTGPVADVYVCHCRDCRRQSASAFGISVIVRRDELRLIRGTPKVWALGLEGAGTKQCAFCPTCGTRLWHISSSEPETVSLKGGGLDSPPDLTGVTHIWVSQKLPGVVIPDGAPQFPEEP